MIFQIFQNITQTLVHTFYQGCMIDFLIVQISLKLLIKIIGIVSRITGVGIIRSMDGIMRHIQIERPVFVDRLFYRLQCFEGQCLGQEGSGVVIFLQARHMETSRTVFILGQITSRSSICGSGNVYIKAEIGRIGTGSRFRTEMSLSAMDGVITGFLQNLRECCNRSSVGQIVCSGLGSRLNTVKIPAWELNHIAVRIGLRIVIQRPVGHTVTGCIHSRHQTASSRRRNGASVCLHEFYSILGHLLHIRSVITTVQRSFFLIERNGCLLPSHIVYQKQNDVRMLL